MISAPTLPHLESHQTETIFVATANASMLVKLANCFPLSAQRVILKKKSVVWANGGQKLRKPTSKIGSAASSVDAYIRGSPQEARAKLVQLRKIIRTAAPDAKESISYKMPYYNYLGALVWFAAFKSHIGIFLRPPVIQEHKRELKGYVTTKSAVHFPINEPLPVALITRLVRARIAKNKLAAKTE